MLCLVYVLLWVVFVLLLLILFGYSAENDKLETMCNYFGIEIEAHNALSDIEATKKLYELICEKFILKA